MPGRPSGRSSLVGALIGAVGINAARSLLTAHFPEWWPIILGSLFVTVVLFLPQGVVGLPRQCLQGLRWLWAQLGAGSNSGMPARGAQAAGEDLNANASTSPRTLGGGG